jgi:O-antigen/teichoic acid export membrane protein
LPISAIGGAALWLTSHRLVQGLADSSSLLWVALAALPPALCLGLLRGVAISQHRWTTVLYERLISSGFRLAAVAIYVSADALTIQSATAIMAISCFVGLLAHGRTICILFHSTDRQAKRHQRRIREPVIGYGLRVWLGSAAGILLSRVDQLLIGPLSTYREAGIYVVAVSVSELVLVFNNALRDFAFRQQSEGPDGLRLAAQARISNLITFALAAGAGASAIYFLPIIFGRDFTGAVPVVLVLLLGIVVGNAGSVVGAGLSGWGKPQYRSYSLLAGLAVNLTLLIFLVDPLGALGAALATLAGNAVAGYLNIYWMARMQGPRLRDVLMPRRADFITLVARVTRHTGRWQKVE